MAPAKKTTTSATTSAAPAPAAEKPAAARKTKKSPVTDDDSAAPAPAVKKAKTSKSTSTTTTTTEAAASPVKKASKPKKAAAATADKPVDEAAAGGGGGSEDDAAKPAKSNGPFVTASIKTICKNTGVQLSGNVSKVLSRFVDRIAPVLPSDGLVGNNPERERAVHCNKVWFGRMLVGRQMSSKQREFIIENAEILLTTIVNTSIAITKRFKKKNVQGYTVAAVASGFLGMYVNEKAAEDPLIDEDEDVEDEDADSGANDDAAAAPKPANKAPKPKKAAAAAPVEADAAATGDDFSQPGEATAMEVTV
jgi:hypothetical protein